MTEQDQMVGQMNLKQRIIAILESRNLTYDALVSYLGIPHSELDRAFDNNTLEIRTLELISKELRIPLYSFFRDDNPLDPGLQAFYDTNIWAPSEITLKVELDELRKELAKAKFELAKQEMIIQSLEEQIKKGK